MRLNLSVAIPETWPRIQLLGSVFGQNGTFREGKIGAWRRHFSAEHEAALRQVAGPLLCQLANEGNDVW